MSERATQLSAYGERKQKQKLEKCNVNQKSEYCIKSNTIGNSLKLKQTH